MQSNRIRLGLAFVMSVVLGFIVWNVAPTLQLKNPTSFQQTLPATITVFLAGFFPSLLVQTPFKHYAITILLGNFLGQAVAIFFSNPTDPSYKVMGAFFAIGYVVSAGVGVFVGFLLVHATKRGRQT